MIYGIERSTDLRCRRTVIKKFTSLAAAKKWSINSGDFTYGDPKGARNYHRTFRYIYNFEGRLPEKEIKNEMRYATRDYPVTRQDAIASVIERLGNEV